MAEAKEFNIAELMKGVPDLGTGRQQITYIPIEKILPNGDNFYSLDGLDELAGSIETIGLQQPLVVRPIEGGMYELISGHRRRVAILMIRDGGSRQFAEGVPCIIDRGEDSPAVRKFKLLMANNDTRRMTSADQNKQAEELENVLRELEDEGYHFSGRLRDWVSKLSGMSRSKLNRLKVIREKLDKQLLKDYYKKGKMNESVAYALAQQPAWMQQRIIGAYRSEHSDCIENMYAGYVENYVKHYNEVNARKCPINKGGLCINKDRLLSKIHAKGYHSSPCTRHHCCADCDEFARCGFRCALMDEKAKAVRDKQREASKDEKAKEKAQKEADVRMIEQIWARFGQALHNAGTTDKKIRGEMNKTARNYNEFEIFMNKDRVAALEDFSCTDVKPNEYLPFHYSFKIEDALRLCKWADELNCTLDYLFCRDDVPNRAAAAAAESVPESGTGAAEWKTGEPTEDGFYACRFDLGKDTFGKALSVPQVAKRQGGKWWFTTINATIDSECLGWYKLPEV